MHIVIFLDKIWKQKIKFVPLTLFRQKRVGAQALESSFQKSRYRKISRLKTETETSRKVSKSLEKVSKKSRKFYSPKFSLKKLIFPKLNVYNYSLLNDFSLKIAFKNLISSKFWDLVIVWKKKLSLWNDIEWLKIKK
mgnify:CR=1 FL=1